MRVLLQGPINDRSHQGRALLGLARALNEQGALVAFAPGFIIPPIPDGLHKLLSNIAPGGGYDLLLSTQTTMSPEIRASVRVAVYLGFIDEDEDCLDEFDLWLCYDSGSSKRARFLDVKAERFMPGVDTSSFPYTQRDWLDHLRFVVSKENAKLAQDAFDWLNVNNTELMERTNPQLVVADYAKSSTPALAKMVKDFHILLCLDEGPDIHQEFMASGGLVSARYTGMHKEWFSNQFSYSWTERSGFPSAESLAAQISLILIDREACARKAPLASASAHQLSWANVLERFFLNSQESLPSGRLLRDAWVRLGY